MENLFKNCPQLFAIKAHANQMYGDMPYAFHLAMVESFLVQNGFDNELYRAAGWLHDVIEDTGVKFEHLEHYYGKIVAHMVLACTGEGTNRKARNFSIYMKLKAFPAAAPVKVADRMANLTYSVMTNNTSKLAMYIKEHAEFERYVSPLMMYSDKRCRMMDKLDKLVSIANGDGDKKPLPRIAV